MGVRSYFGHLVILSSPGMLYIIENEILRKIKWNRSKVEIIDVTPKEIK